MKKSDVRQYEPGSTGFVLVHGVWSRGRGRRLSATLRGGTEPVRNPHLAFQEALRRQARSGFQVGEAWWLSWWTPSLEGLELHAPWWVSGERGDNKAVVAAIRAPTAALAWLVIRAAYDTDPEQLETRLIRPLRRSPFSARFPQASWMTWDLDGRTCCCDHPHV